MKETILKIKELMGTKRSKCLFDCGYIHTTTLGTQVATVFFSDHSGKINRLFIDAQQVYFDDGRTLHIDDITKRIYRPCVVTENRARHLQTIKQRMENNSKLDSKLRDVRVD